MIVLSPSAGSSQRVTGVKCIAMVRVPSGAAAATPAPASHRTTATIRTRRMEPSLEGSDLTATRAQPQEWETKTAALLLTSSSVWATAPTTAITR